jgi:curved DNA-binding protein CbpA
MLPCYIALNLAPDASDEEIRSRYIYLVKKYSPEKNPQRFGEITKSYEAIKNKRKRVENKIFGPIRAGNGDFENNLYSMIKKEDIKVKRVGFKELVKASEEQ